MDVIGPETYFAILNKWSPGGHQVLQGSKNRWNVGTVFRGSVFALSKVKKGPNRASCAALIKLWFTAFIAIIKKVKHTFPEKRLFVS